jgi:hypothetical protein
MTAPDRDRRLAEAWRALPETPVKARAAGLLADVLSFLADPGCASAQADGVPCDTPHASCDGCRRTLETIDRLRRELLRT